METEVTELLESWRNGDEQASQALWPLLQSELKNLARSHLSGQRPGHTLQATALVNEAFIKLVNADFRGASRKQFLALASKAMRSILVDHARSQKRAKRGGEAIHLTLTEVASANADADEILLVDELLSRLSEIDERMGRIVELKVFGGLTYDEIASLMDISSATVRADMKFGLTWLKKELDR